MQLFATTSQRDHERSSHRSGEQALREILSGPDSPHRRELETMLEERDR